jgi:PAS domain S-box-containing protein
MARRILPLAIVAPFAIGWLLVEAERQGSYGFEFGAALFATSTAILFAFLIWITAVSLNSGHARQLRAEQALLASESRLRTVIDSALTAVVVIDSAGRIIDWNTRAEEMFGWGRDESIGRELADRIIPPRYREAHRRGLGQFLATGQGPVLNRVIELTALRRDGTEFPVELFISSMDAGNALAFCGFVTDISERKQAQQALISERTLLRTLIDALPDVVFTKDLAGRFSLCNAAAVKHHGISREQDLLGKSVHDLYPRELADVYHADDMEAAAGKSILNSEEPSLDAAGRRRWFLTTKVPLYDHDGRIAAIVGISRDITERKEAEEEIRRLNAELEQRVVERTAELHAKNQELETFTYTVSHDLKAPLRGIDGYSRLLLEDYDARLDDEGRRFLGNIRAATGHMQQLIDDLLTYSRVERRSLSMTRIDPRATVEEILRDRAHDLQGVKVSVEVDPEPVVADLENFRMALRNLIDNALKFSRRRDAPEIEITSRVEGGLLVVVVRDNGTGFDMKYHDRIFQIFQRLHRAEDYSGTGVGLAIVHKAMERMGGRVWAQSEPDKGATFYLALPRGSARAASGKDRNM